MKRYRFYLAAFLIFLAVAAISENFFSVTGSHYNTENYEQNHLAHQTGRFDKTARSSDMTLHVVDKKWVKEWILAFNDSSLAHSLLSNQIKLIELDTLFKDLDDETILKYLSQQSNFWEDEMNWRLYILLQRRALDKDPKLVVDYMRKLGTKDCEVTVLDEAMASFVMLDDQDYIKYLISECGTSYFQSSGYPYLKKLKESGYTYKQGVEAIYKFDQAAAKMLVETFFTYWSDVPRVNDDESMWISKQEKIELINFVQMKFPEYDMSGSVAAIEKIKEKQQ